MVEKNLADKFDGAQRLAMIGRDSELPISRQAELLGVARSNFYYKAAGPSEDDLRIRSLIDRTYMEHPEFGSRRISIWLRDAYGVTVNRKAVQNHMRQMGIEAIYPRQNTSRQNPENKIYPYLLKDLAITHPDQVWSIDISYIPIRKSWLYLVAIIDWYSRYVLSWKLDDTLDIRFVLEACSRALSCSRPETMNSDQGSHFTSPKYIQLFLDAGCRISMDHRGRAYDNIFIERLWRSVKYENVYLQDYESPRMARQGICAYFQYYNEKRPHQSLGYRKPAEIYLGSK